MTGEVQKDTLQLLGGSWVVISVPLRVPSKGSIRIL